MSLRALRVAALAVSVAACEGADGTPRVSSPSTAIDAMTLPETDAGASVEPSIEPSLELGTGFSVFAPLEPDQSIEIIAGPQGGFHL